MFDKFFLSELAMKYVAYAQKRNEAGEPIAYFAILYGVGSCKLAFSSGDPHNYKMIIDAIHKYQAKHPKKNVKEGYNIALSKAIDAVTDRDGIITIFNWLDYEFEKQKNATSTFRLNYRELLTQLRNSVVNDANRFRTENKNFDSWFYQRIEEMEQKSSQRR